MIGSRVMGHGSWHGKIGSRVRSVIPAKAAIQMILLFLFLFTLAPCPLPLDPVCAGTTTTHFSLYKPSYGDPFATYNAGLGGNFDTIDTHLLKAIWVKQYASLTAAITAASTTMTDLIVDTPITLTQSDTVPATCTLWIIGQGTITKASTYKLNINGAFIAPARQVFYGFSDDDIRFGAGSIPGLALYPQYWGAKGDNSTDCAAAIQAAITAAAGSGAIYTGRKVYFPSGTYLTSAKNVVPFFAGPPYTITIEGENWENTWVQASADMDYVLGTDGTGGTQNNYFHLKNIYLDANNHANYAFYTIFMSNSLFENVFFTKAKVAGAYLGYGVVNRLNNCRLIYNYGHGLQADTLINNLILDGCMFLSNAGLGAKLSSGSNIVIRGGDFELNAKGGLFAASINSLVINGVRFEGNAVTGQVLNISAGATITAHADVIIAGAGTSEIFGAAFPVTGLQATGNFHETATGGATAAYYLIGLTGGKIADNRANILSGTLHLVETRLGTVYPYSAAINGLIAENNTGFTDNLLVSGTQLTNNPHGMDNWDFREQQVRNYAVADLTTWTSQASGAGTSTIAPGAAYNGLATEVISMDSGQTGYSNYWGFTIDIDSYAELASQVAYIGLWVKQNSVSAGSRLYYDNGSAVFTDTSSSNASTAWRYITMEAVLPASGTVKFAVSLMANADTDTLSFTKPVVSLVGTPYYKIAVSSFVP